MSLICDFRGGVFSRNYALKRHIEKQHKSAPLRVDKPRWNCSLCEYESSTSNLRKHYKVDHKIQLEEKTLHSDGENSFKDWKHKIEKETVCKCVPIRGEKNGRRIFYCHRS